MKKFKRRLSLLLLALVFIGGAELIACYFLDPPIFDKITAPVRQAASAAMQAGGNLLRDAHSAFSDALADVQAQQAEPPEPQKASDPQLTGAGIPIQDPTITELTIRNGQETLTGGSLPITYYAQFDPAWRDAPYGRDNIGSYGCGPTVMAMAVRSLTGLATDPAQMAIWCSQNGYCAPGSGSYHTIVQGVAASFGLECTAPDQLDAAELRTQLSGGRIAVALMTAGHFTNSGHFILLRGVTLDGNLLVADPNSRERSLQEWDPQLILNELSHSRVAGAPLWFLSLPN